MGCNDHHHYSRISTSRVLCPVEIHVDASVENADASALEGSQRNLLNLDSDDENILGNRYIFVRDGLSSDNTPENIAYPDANSHSNYNLLTEDTQSFDSWSKNLPDSYSVANSHRNTFQDSNSHSKYDVFSDTSDKSPKSMVANIHGTYRILSESSDRAETENLSREILIPPEDSNYETANSHSNYQIFYNSQTQEHNPDKSLHDRQMRLVKNLNVASPTRSYSSRSSRSTEETSTTCDIEECLVQIEESLLNIEQNLLHVQDLDIPELKNLLYKSPSIERSLYEVQDLLCTENLESAKRGQLFSFNYDGDDDDNLIDISSKDLSPGSEHDCTFTNDENLLQFSDDKVDKILVDDPSGVSGALNSLFYASTDKNVNFIPNSLDRTPTKGSFNIKSSSLDNGTLSKERVSQDVINDNLDSRMTEKNILQRKKCHSRTNSLDENSSGFQSTETPSCQRKTSLESFLRFAEEADVEDDLDKASTFGKKPKHRRRSKENRLAEVEAKTEEFRRKIENIISNRQSILPNPENPQRNSRTKPANDHSEVRGNSQETSPRLRKSSLQEKDKDQSPNAKQFKCNSFEKRKRRKANRIPSAENAALVPSKLISLSLSLLLAALLQAVRCLTDLVEDAFRSVSYDKNGLFNE